MVDRQEVSLDDWENEGGFVAVKRELRTYEALRLELEEALQSTVRNHLRKLSPSERAMVTSSPYMNVPLRQIPPAPTTRAELEAMQRPGAEPPFFLKYVGGDPS